MKLTEVLNHENGLEMTYLVGCYERFQQCKFSHQIQTTLCQQELYQEELNQLESKVIQNAISQNHQIQSARVYHLGKIGIDEFRRQRFLNESEFSNSFDLQPPKYSPETCEEYKKRASSLPISIWVIMTVGALFLTLNFAPLSFRNSLRIYFSPSQPALPISPLVKFAPTLVKQTEKLAALFLVSIFTAEKT